eukprot:3934710-Rhodomonas_salina.1
MYATQEQHFASYNARLQALENVVQTITTKRGAIAELANDANKREFLESLETRSILQLLLKKEYNGQVDRRWFRDYVELRWNLTYVQTLIIDGHRFPQGAGGAGAIASDILNRTSVRLDSIFNTISYFSREIVSHAFKDGVNALMDVDHDKLTITDDTTELGWISNNAVRVELNSNFRDSFNIFFHDEHFTNLFPDESDATTHKTQLFTTMLNQYVSSRGFSVLFGLNDFEGDTGNAADLSFCEFLTVTCSGRKLFLQDSYLNYKAFNKTFSPQAHAIPFNEAPILWSTYQTDSQNMLFSYTATYFRLVILSYSGYLWDISHTTETHTQTQFEALTIWWRDVLKCVGFEEDIINNIIADANQRNT